ncbi:hypothetical protein Ancab_019650 [Ancistrocladus abbreviatus]
MLPPSCQQPQRENLLGRGLRMLAARASMSLRKDRQLLEMHELRLSLILIQFAPWCCLLRGYKVTIQCKDCKSTHWESSVDEGFASYST